MTLGANSLQKAIRVQRSPEKEATINPILLCYQKLCGSPRQGAPTNPMIIPVPLQGARRQGPSLSESIIFGQLDMGMVPGHPRKGPGFTKPLLFGRHRFRRGGKQPRVRAARRPVFAIRPQRALNMPLFWD